MEVLKQLAWKHSLLKYPSLPDHARTVKKYSDRTEKGLIECILDLLKFTGNFGERVNNRGFMKDNREVVTDVVGRAKMIGSKQWIKSSQTPGTADISAIIRGYTVKIEVKIGKDRQSEAQKKYQQMIEQSGGLYLIVKSFDDFYRQYLDIVTGVLKPIKYD